MYYERVIKLTTINKVKIFQSGCRRKLWMYFNTLSRYDQKQVSLINFVHLFQLEIHVYCSALKYEIAIENWVFHNANRNLQTSCLHTSFLKLTSGSRASSSKNFTKVLFLIVLIHASPMKTYTEVRLKLRSAARVIPTGKSLKRLLLRYLIQRYYFPLPHKVLYCVVEQLESLELSSLLDS